jgi:energy-coupling factor transport system permease protein
VFALLSVPFNVLTGSSGPTVLARLPELSFPRSFGGVTFGGAITAEALVTATNRALSVALLVIAAVAFNSAVDHGRLLRLAPRSLAQVTTMFTIALLVVPQAAKQARAVAEARRLRGRSTRGVAALAVLLPVLQGALERAVQRAESLDARGFGGGTQRASWRASLGGVAGLGLCCWGAFAHFYYGGDLLSSLAIVAGAAIVVFALLRGGEMERRRATRDDWHGIDWVVTLCALGSVAMLLALRIAGAGEVTYLAYPRVVAPAFHPLGAAAFVLLLAPAVAGTAEERTP